MGDKDTNELIVEKVSDFFNDNSVMSAEDWDNVLIQVEEERTKE